MPTRITMPKLSDTMEEGTILRWYKQVGQAVEQGEVIAEVETDKADMELEAEQSGVLEEIKVNEGEVAAVGAVIAVLGDGGEAKPAKPAAPAAAAAAQTQAAKESGGRSTAAASQAPAAAPTAKPSAQPGAKPAAAAPPPPATAGAKPVGMAKPTATTPPGQPAATNAPPQSAPPQSTPPQSAPPPPPSSLKWKPRAAKPDVTAGRHEVSKLRQTVAKQMTTSKREVPHFYVVSEIDMSEAARVREALLESGALPERITYTHLLIRALTLILQRHPRVNASWADGAVEVHEDINIGIAVAIDDGLVAPVLHRCQDLSLRQIAHATQGLVEKAQGGKFSGAEMTGATFTISNMGMLDIDEFSAVITPPQAAILAVGSIKERPVARNGQLAVAKTMRVTLSVDHRVLNGVEAGRFLEDLKRTLEHPVLLVVSAE